MAADNHLRTACLLHWGCRNSLGCHRIPESLCKLHQSRLLLLPCSRDDHQLPALPEQYLPKLLGPRQKCAPGGFKEGTTDRSSEVNICSTSSNEVPMKSTGTTVGASEASQTNTPADRAVQVVRRGRSGRPPGPGCRCQTATCQLVGAAPKTLIVFVRALRC